MRRSRSDNPPSLTFALLLGACAAFGSCGDEVVSEYEVFLSPTTIRLSADGSDATEVSVSVLDQNSAPPEFGAAVIVFCVNDRGEPAGWMGGPESGQTRIPLDQVGLAGIVLSCDGDPGADSQLQCLGSYEGDGATGAMRPISCVAVPPEED